MCGRPKLTHRPGAFGAIFDGPTLKDGVEKATKQLQDLKGGCGPTLTSG
jgi:hypothetical protein